MGKSYASGGSGSTIGKSYASGGSGSASGKSYTSGGSGSTFGKSYASGGNPAKPPTNSSSPPGGNYPASANPNRPPSSAAPTGRSSSAGNSGVKPTGKSSYDAAAAQSQRQTESRANFQKGQAPQSSYVDSTGATRKVDPRDAQIKQLRHELTYERWVNRDYRMRTYYGSYWSRPVVYYNDPYNSFFWWWLLDQSLETRAFWAYNHYDYMDRARYNDLLARDANLRARVEQLEHQQGLTRNPNWAPQNMDYDLMVTDNVATAAYNPVPPPAVPVGVAPAYHPVSLLHVLWVLIKFIMVFAFIAFLIWLVFIKRWGATAI
jgi:hypothetical protein